MTEWEEAQQRIARWHKAHAEGPAPPGKKRCMNCYEVMDYDAQCECLIETGRQIRESARRSLVQLVKDDEPPAQGRTKKKQEDQGSLFQ